MLLPLDGTSWFRCEVVEHTVHAWHLGDDALGDVAQQWVGGSPRWWRSWHEGCKYYTVPKSNTEFWVNKVKRNKERDHRLALELVRMGWHYITIWECELKP